MMTDIGDLQKKYGSRALMLSLGLAGILILFGEKANAKGLVLGTLFSIINFVIIGHTLPLRLNRDRRKSFLFSLGSIWFRYALLAIPLIIAFYCESFEFFAAAAGLFMIQFIILAHHLGQMVSGHAPYR